ncbi:hypothetical protein WM42_2045 [Corynebacterium simulans]|uniref:pyocin knob domain-containing protein n=1 Tax=Corynebacterium simulans TaxID=146827 RepID=UPI0007842C9F|nr:pyocin knob domain-containing protein [Corynebacterium simulans]AMO89747.1 hypothetical protein WM42_2045 [Corynebacterium simulans]
MTDFNGKVQGNFVDDDDIVRTGRVMIELNGYGFMQVPIPTGLKQAWDDLRGESSTNLQEIRSKTSQAVSSADSASKSAAAAKSSESNAASSKNVAASSASAAAGSASAAKTSETNASNSAAAAKSSEQAAAGSATEAKTSASAAKQSESNAASSKSAAAGSAAEAKTSASAAKQDADRAAAARTATENIAKSTSWNGDQLTVNGKTSPHLKGDKGDKGDPGDVTNVTWDVVKNKPATFPPSTHTHTSIQITDATNAATANMVVKRDASGRAQFSDPSSGADAATKAYVDAQDVKIGALGSGVDLNTVTTTGAYHQNLTANAQNGKNYPIGQAGLLEVFNPDASMTYQRYTVYGGYNQVFTRGLYSNAWGAWKEVSTAGHTHVSADISDAQNGYTLTSTATNGRKLVQISSNGTLEVHANNMTNGNGNAVVNKAYVDSLATEVRAFAASRAVVKQVTSPPSSFESGVLYVIPE